MIILGYKVNKYIYRNLFSLIRLEKIIKKLEKHSVATAIIGGGVLGYGFISSVAMILFDRLHRMYSETYDIKSHLSSAFEIFKPEFLPWSLTFTVATAGILGIIKHYSNQISKMQKEKEEDLLYRATHDDLTGLYNQAALEKQLDYQLVQRNDVETSLFFIDLDGFKQVNDTYGHGDGNKVLKEVADRLSKYFRKSDYICRYGGDEFVIMMDQSQKQNRTILAERLLENLSMPYLDDKISFVSCSIGIAVSNNGNTAQNLLSRADSAMYKAKKTGKNRFVYDNSGKLSTSTF